MKKIALLFMIPIFTLMAIDFTMTKTGLYKEITTEQPATDLISNPTTSTISDNNNSYLEIIDLPACDINNPEVQFIKTNTDWSHINDSNKRIFCVSPGDYTQLKEVRGSTLISGIKITRSGTEKKRRYILLNNGNNLHPGKLNKSQLANYTLDIQGASFWTIDRAASFDVNFSHSFIINKNSTHNIFNRLFTENLFHAMWIREFANYNTIQNSRFNGITLSGAGADLAAINVNGYLNTYEVLGTKVINNEFVNVKAFRINRYPETHTGYPQYVNYAGTIFDNNTIEFNNKIRTDCNGNLDKNGECIAGEATGIGVKSGSDDEDEPIVISNNKMWGYRSADRSYPNLSNEGVFATVYYGSKNVHLKNNIIFDGTNGIIFADREDRERGSYNGVVTGNLIVACGEKPRAPRAFSISISQAENILVKNNIIKDSTNAWVRIIVNYYNNTFTNNTAINKGSDLLYIDNHEPILGLRPKNNNLDISTEEANKIYTKDYIFTTDRFTNYPRTIKLKNLLKP